MKPETIQKLTELYNRKKFTIEWMMKFGNETERVKAELIKEIATKQKIGFTA